MHKWFTSYLSNRFHYSQLGTLSSSLTPLTTGVSQGSTLDPILFLLYVNDVFTINRNCKIVFFADDTCIGVSANNNNTLFSYVIRYFVSVLNGFLVIDHFTNICKFYVRMRSCSKQADCRAK